MFLQSKKLWLNIFYVINDHTATQITITTLRASMIMMMNESKWNQKSIAHTLTYLQGAAFSRILVLPIDSYVKFTDFEQFLLLYYTWSREGTTLIWNFNPSTIQKSYEKGRLAGNLKSKLQLFTTCIKPAVNDALFFQ